MTLEREAIRLSAEDEAVHHENRYSTFDPAAKKLPLTVPSTIKYPCDGLRQGRDFERQDARIKGERLENESRRIP